MLDVRLSPYARVVAHWMAEHANAELLTAFPSVDTLVKLTGFSKRQIQYARKELVECDWLSLVERKPGPHGSARYKLTIGLTVLPPRCATVKAAMRMFSIKSREKLVSPQIPIAGEMVHGQDELVHSRSPDGAQLCTNYGGNGAQPCTRTSSKREPPNDQCQDQRHREDADADAELVERIEKVFRETVRQVYGNSARPMKPSRVLRREASENLRNGLTLSEICNVIEEGTRKMGRKGHAAPACLSALSCNFDDALCELTKVNINTR